LTRNSNLHSIDDGQNDGDDRECNANLTEDADTLLEVNTAAAFCDARHFELGMLKI
jgi:hypothetical protein